MAHMLVSEGGRIPVVSRALGETAGPSNQCQHTVGSGEWKLTFFLVVSENGGVRQGFRKSSQAH
jgi:hypothetical protein